MAQGRAARVLAVSASMTVLMFAGVGCESPGSSASTTSEVDATPAPDPSAPPTVGSVTESTVGTSSRLTIRPVLACEPAPLGVPPVSADAPEPAVGARLLDITGTEECEVGPVAATAAIFEPGSAVAAILGGTWGVTVELRKGVEGERLWNAIASDCYRGDATCPSHRLAIEVDGLIVSAPTLNTEQFAGSVQISGQFSKAQAERIAAVINGT